VRIADDPCCAPIRFYHSVHLEGPRRYHDLRDDEVSPIYFPMHISIYFLVFEHIDNLRVSLKTQSVGDDSKDLPKNDVVVILHWCYKSEDGRDSREIPQ
jgi:hypothetical protein